MYGKYWDRKEAEECEGGQRRLSTPTSLVMEIIECNIWIAIFMLQMRESNRDRGEKEAVRVLIGSRPHLPTKFSSKISFSQLKFSKQYECVHIIGGLEDAARRRVL